MKNQQVFRHIFIIFLTYILSLPSATGQRAFSVELRGHLENVSSSFFKIRSETDKGVGLLVNYSLDKENHHQIKTGIIQTRHILIFPESYYLDYTTGFDVWGIFTSKLDRLSLPCFYVFNTQYFYAEAGVYADFFGKEKWFIDEKKINTITFSYPASNIKAHLGVGGQYWYKRFGVKLGASVDVRFKSTSFPTTTYFRDLNLGLAYQFQKKQN